MKNKIVYAFAALVVLACAKSSKPLETHETAAFATKQVRYLTPLDILQTLNRLFPAQSGYVVQNCKMLTDESRGILGDSSAATGSPIFQEPNAGFIRWYVGCVKQYATNFAQANHSEFVGPTFAKLTANDPYAAYSSFSKLSHDVQLKIVEDQIERLIGPSEIIEDFGFFKSSEELAQHILDSLPNIDGQADNVIKDIVIAIAVRDEFLSY